MYSQWKLRSLRFDKQGEGGLLMWEITRQHATVWHSTPLLFHSLISFDAIYLYFLKCLSMHQELLFHLLEFCDWDIRAKCLRLSRAHAQLLTSTESYQWLSQRLMVENGIYYSLICHQDSKIVFEQNWKQRWLWRKQAAPKFRKESEKEEADNVYSIRVACRFKPRQETKALPQKDLTTTRHKIVLPLHQRLAIIRMNRQLSSQKQALRVLQE